MYYRLKYGKNYLIKIIILVLAAVIGELIIWWAMVREDSVDYIAGQVLHNPWPYAITKLEDGRIIVGNITKGYEVTLPAGWQIERAQHPVFSYIKDEKNICQIMTNQKRYEEEVSVGKLLKETEKYIYTYAGVLPAIKKEETKIEIQVDGQELEKFNYNLQIPVDKDIITYTLIANEEDRYECRQFFEKIRRSFLYYE
ncbi:MAG: hypothetical protein ABIG60_03610 [Patescibacteria group bacterium]